MKCLVVLLSRCAGGATVRLAVGRTLQRPLGPEVAASS
jgi:hypothetical protein